MLNSYMWLVATILDNEDIEHFYHLRNPALEYCFKRLMPVTLQGMDFQTKFNHKFIFFCL